MMDELKIKELGQTIENEGEIILIARDMPINCMVLFVDMDTWHKIKDFVRIDDN